MKMVIELIQLISMGHNIHCFAACRFHTMVPRYHHKRTNNLTDKAIFNIKSHLTVCVCKHVCMCVCI